MKNLRFHIVLIVAAFVVGVAMLSVAARNSPGSVIEPEK